LPHDDVGKICDLVAGCCGFEAMNYPETVAERDRWIVAHRRDLNASRMGFPLNRPIRSIREEEAAWGAGLVNYLTVFLTNRECPWNCLMCDLWQETSLKRVSPGDIPSQIRFALSKMAPGVPDRLKLYNAGSFFDAGAIPPEDYSSIAGLCRGFKRVVVECHPNLVGPRILRFQRELGETELEIAMGLETVEAGTLELLNKRMSLEDYSRAAKFLKDHGIRLRSFVLVRPPFMEEQAAEFWAQRSIDFAFGCGAELVALIPTRGGNGALESLKSDGQFSEPRLSTLAAALRYGLALGKGIVIADLWDVDRWSRSDAGYDQLRRSLDLANRTQRWVAPIAPNP
jgi:radical SAM enzyme (TIGR01210 family)